MFKGLDQHGEDFPLEDVKWWTTGGTIDPNDIFYAGEDEGELKDIALIDSVQVTVRALVTGKKAPPVIPPTFEEKARAH